MKRSIRKARPRVADEIMTGMRELERMLDENRTPEEMFTVRTIEIPKPAIYHARHVRALRGTLGVSQAVFASLLGVSLILVKSWERGVREPNPMARRLLDTIKADPSRWLSSLHQTRAA